MMTIETGFPQRGAYRGIPSPRFFASEAHALVLSDAFTFDAVSDGGSLRGECSINWIFGDGAIVQIAQQTNPRKGEGARQFEGGACRIELSDLEFLQKNYGRRLLSWERCPTFDESGRVVNPYHGNLLSVPNPKGVEKGLVRDLRSNLASYASRTEIITRKELDEYIS